MNMIMTISYGSDTQTDQIEDERFARECGEDIRDSGQKTWL